MWVESGDGHVTVCPYMDIGAAEGSGVTVVGGWWLGVVARSVW